VSKRFQSNSCTILGTFSKLLLGLLPVVCLLSWNAVAQVSSQLSAQTSPVPDPSQSAPLTLTLQDALKRARSYTPQFQAAVTELGVAQQEKTQGRAGLLPSVNYTTQYLYTQGNSLYAHGNLTPSGFRFIANNAVHEYVSQGNVHEALSLDNLAAYRRASAGVALAKAKAEIAERGLTVTIVQAYYGLLVAERKYSTAQQADAESRRFADISQKLERGGEVAHSDVLKAQIQSQQQQRDLQEAQLAMERARVELAILLFPNFNQNFTIVDDLGSPQTLPALSEVQQMAGRNNPQQRAAVAALRQANQDVVAGWGGFLPSLTFDYVYGIDATHFATRTDGVPNLGYAASASLELPVWNWGANRAKLKQASLQRDQARVELTFAQRQLVGDMQSFYKEAETSRAELESLKASTEMAAESLRLATLRYQAGEATVLEVVDAQNTFTQTRNLYDDGQARFRLAIANLQTLTGNF
jgi:outer membrane protein TolC